MSGYEEHDRNDSSPAEQSRKANSQIEAEILKGLCSGDPSAMTEEDWQAVQQEVRQRHACGRKRLG